MWNFSCAPGFWHYLNRIYVLACLKSRLSLTFLPTSLITLLLKIPLEQSRNSSSKHSHTPARSLKRHKYTRPLESFSLALIILAENVKGRARICVCEWEIKDYMCSCKNKIMSPARDSLMPERTFNLLVFWWNLFNYYSPNHLWSTFFICLVNFSFVFMNFKVLRSNWILKNHHPIHSVVVFCSPL